MMTKCVRFLGVVAALCGAGLLSMAADDEKKDNKEVVEAITKQAEEMTKKDWSAATKEGEGIAKKHMLEDIMNLMKLRRKDPKGGGFVGGVGLGTKPGAVSPDGIEAKIINLTKNPMPLATLNKQSAELIRMAEITAAIASATVHLSPVEKKMGQKDPAKWKELMKDMHGASLDLIDAVKKKDAAGVKKMANKLNGTCTECHGIFRDDK